MKTMKFTALLCTAIVLSGAATIIKAEDFSQYTNQELEQMRSKVRNMSEADRTAYRNENLNRMSSMSEDERAQARNRINEAVGQGTTTRQRSMDGSQSGGQYGRGNNSGGSGNAGNRGSGGRHGK
ncbi:MAG TPA: hypothetical protein VIQ03_08195 [Gammaproteobacteria bacterium]